MINKYQKYKDSKVNWIGEIPDSWHVSKIRYNAKVVGRIGYRGYTVEDIVERGEGAISLSPSNIQNQKFDLTKRTYISWGKYEESPEIQVFENDVILVKTASVGKVAYVDSLEGEKATINPQLVVFKEITLSPKFFYYYLISNDFQYQIDRDNYGGVVGTLTQASINSYKILVPSDLEQTKIAQYLDHQTAIIDQLILQKEKLIELLKEKRQAVINEAVTKGLDPIAKMKDSGIEWLGEVPENWKHSKLKWISEIFAGGTPSTNVDEFWQNGTIPWLNSGSVNQKRINMASEFITEEAVLKSSTKWVPKGAILMALAGQGKTKGTVAILEIDATCNQSMAAIVPDPIVKNEYLYYWLHVNYERIRGLAGSEQRDGLNLQIIGDIFCPLPPISEQIEIIYYIYKIDTKTDSAVMLIEDQIMQLKEYRQSIISEAVIGKIDVRDWQPNKKQVA